MSKNKILVSEINNIWHFERYEKALIASDFMDDNDNFRYLDRYFARKYLSENNIDMEYYGFESTLDYFWISYHPFYVVNYDTKKKKLITPNTCIFKSTYHIYPKEYDIVEITFNKYSKKEIYIASKDELKKYTISAFNAYFTNYFNVLFTLDKYEKQILPIIKQNNIKDYYRNEKLTTIFQIYDLDVKWHQDFIPLLGILKEFILFQNEDVQKYFLPGMLNIINDAKKMLSSNINEYDKKDMLEETIEVLIKLKNSINDISPYDFSLVKDVDKCFENVHNSERNKEIEKEKQIQLLNMEKEKNKKKYLETLRSKSELIDYFNA